MVTTVPTRLWVVVRLLENRFACVRGWKTIWRPGDVSRVPTTVMLRDVSESQCTSGWLFLAAGVQKMIACLLLGNGGVVAMMLQLSRGWLTWTAPALMLQPTRRRLSCLVVVLLVTNEQLQYPARLDITQDPLSLLRSTNMRSTAPKCTTRKPCAPRPMHSVAVNCRWLMRPLRLLICLVQVIGRGDLLSSLNVVAMEWYMTRIGDRLLRVPRGLHYRWTRHRPIGLLVQHITALKRLLGSIWLLARAL